MSCFVIDASATGSLVMPDEHEPHGMTIGALIHNARLLAAPHWPVEVGNMLLVGMRRGRLDDAGRTRAIRRLKALAIEPVSQEADTSWTDAFAIAMADDLTLYDAAYLDIALKSDAGLLTLDTALAAAARARGIATPLLP